MSAAPQNRSPDALWWVLDRIQDDLNRMDEKWDENIAAMTRLTENLAVVSGKVQELNKLLVVDNGKPSVVTQVREVTDEVRQVKELIHTLKADVEAVKEQTIAKPHKEVQLEKFKTYGAIVGVVGLVIPTILSWFGYFH